MDGDTLYSIGELARRTGLTVKAIRFYSDRGIVAPTNRSPAGHRRYDAGAAARLDLVRTLRDLGLGLATIRRILDRELSLAEVAATHAEALAVQIQALRLRHAVLSAVAERGLTAEETDLMHRSAQLSAGERRRLVDDFLDAVLGAGPALAAARRSMTPEPPDDPDPRRLRAWTEWAELALDSGFRARMRRMTEDHLAEHAPDGTPRLRPDLAATVRQEAGPAVAAGVEPAARQADPAVAAVAAYYAGLVGRPDDAALRRRLLRRLDGMGDPRRDRHFRLLAEINDWPAPEPLAPALNWSAAAVRARLDRTPAG
ncbi:MerR family transcriptional regulator [Sphaerisporangium rufum]|uniref:MerR family transcriptional regulator n=1 Tax=Sphaerisporangium rufum TaxID=1381558 RepID=A0A919QYQ1_9ACTN|nr:MerR family transcriptional regulator [Sphaerisporangium rufum]GII76427.1 MerR family transcriptional regulator [Sphaerisporangium rufum]